MNFNIRRLFHHFQRVTAENIHRIINILQNLITQLQLFHYLIVKVADSALFRVNKAIFKINRMARDDMGSTLHGIKFCKSKYDGGIAIKVETALYHLDAFHSDIQNMEYRLSSVDSNKPGMYAFWNVRDAAENLYVSLDAIRTIPEYIDRFTLNRLWSTNRYVSCQSKYTLMLDIITRITELLSRASVNWEQINQTNNYDYNAGNKWSEQFINYNRQANNTIGDVEECSTEFKNVLEGAYETISSLETTLQTMLWNDFYFNFDDVLDLVWNDLETINSNISYFEDLLTKYSRNDTTKLDIASSLTAVNHAHLEDALSSILSRIDTQAVEPLHNMMRTSRVNIKKWLHNSLSAMGTLVPYFDTCIEKMARFSRIWRYPVVKLDSPDILVYTYNGNSFKTWPETKSLRTLLENRDDETLFTEILKSYGHNVSIALYELQARLSSSKKETLTALGNLLTDVQSVHQQSIIDKDFIL